MKRAAIGTLGPSAQAQIFAEIGKTVPAKYRSERAELDGRNFASKAEARRYASLNQLQTIGEITNLRCQVPFALVVNGVKICDYVADFTYLDKAGAMVVEDVKGVATPAYKLKKKLMAALYGVDIKEVTR